LGNHDLKIPVIEIFLYPLPFPPYNRRLFLTKQIIELRINIMNDEIAKGDVFNGDVGGHVLSPSD
jgi:hypothetical protein